MMKTQNGFNLVEVMIVVAIIGIVATFAVPLYRDYMERSKVSEAVMLLGGLRDTCTEFYYYHSHWPVSVASVGGKSVGTYVSIITTGVQAGNSALETFYWVEATMKGELGPDPANNENSIYGRQLRFTFDDGNRDWYCSADEVSGYPIPSKFLPTACR